VLLAACGGSGGGPGAPSGAPTTTPTTLTLSVSSLALKTSGIARTVTVTNTGGAPAMSVIYSLTPDTYTTAISSCSTLAPGATCQITITPGATASAAAGNDSPVPINLNVGGLNTNVASASVHVLDFGSVYQSGYVFDFNDGTSNTGSVGGKVVALADIAASPLPWSTLPNLVNASSLTDGFANTQVIVAVFDGMSVPRANYAAGACTELNASGYTGWYLPAICEMSTAAAGCTPGQPDIQSLVDNSSTLPPTPAQQHWSSTESATPPFSDAVWHQFALGGGTQSDLIKGTAIQARCVRALP
jgi:hypothetical protein